MKKISVLICCFSLTQAFCQMTLKPSWETDTTLTTPEAVIFSPKENILYVSCINGGPSAENKGSFIAKVGLDGKVKNLKFSPDLNSTKGMALMGDKLFVTEIFKVVEIDTKTGKVLKKYEVPEAKFLNDITTDEKTGTVYFTDMRSNRIWQLQKGVLTKVAEEAPLTNPNGLFFEKGKLLVGNGDGKLLIYDLKSKQFSTFAEGMGGIDGITPDGQKGYFASEWQGKIWHIAPDGKTQLLHDSSAQKINTADFEYIPSKKMMYVPTFFHNRVLAFEVK